MILRPAQLIWPAPSLTKATTTNANQILATFTTNRLFERTNWDNIVCGINVEILSWQTAAVAGTLAGLATIKGSFKKVAGVLAIIAQTPDVTNTTALTTATLVANADNITVEIWGTPALAVGIRHLVMPYVSLLQAP